MGGKQRNKEHKRRIDKVLKCKRERFDLCCIHVVNFAINHHRKEGVMSFAAVERAAGVTSVNKHWTTDTVNSLKKEPNRRGPQTLPQTNR